MKPLHLRAPSVIKAVGTKPKRIEEFVGQVNSADPKVSIARMRSPAGWEEPGQTPEFTEYTIVLSGVLRVEWKGGSADVKANEAIVVPAGSWIRYSTPTSDAEYLAVCLPAFSPQTVHRDS